MLLTNSCSCALDEAKASNLKSINFADFTVRADLLSLAKMCWGNQSSLRSVFVSAFALILPYFSLRHKVTGKNYIREKQEASECRRTLSTCGMPAVAT